VLPWSRHGDHRESTAIPAEDTRAMPMRSPVYFEDRKGEAASLRMAGVLPGERSFGGGVGFPASSCRASSDSLFASPLQESHRRGVAG